MDAIAGTGVSRFSSLEDIDALRYDVTNIAHALNRRGRVCVIGVGGGRDIQSAILFGHEDITGIEVNPIFVRLLTEEFGKYAGLAGRAGVRIIIDEARSCLTRLEETFTLIEMSLVDSWSATGAGAYTLSENALYTLEGWKVFFARLADNGVYSVSRWHDPEDLGETGRVLSLAVATLLTSGVDNPLSHIALVSSHNLATLTLISLIAALCVLVAATLAAPFLVRRALKGPDAASARPDGAAAFYFAMIGAGFMFVEIALIQKFTIYLGHPTYSLAFVLFTLILSTGGGSFLSEFLPLTRRPGLYLYPLVTATLIVFMTVFLMPELFTRTITFSLPVKALLTLLSLSPLGLACGLAFPTGMQLIRRRHLRESPWYWAINGICGVLAGALTVFISIYISISSSLFVGAICYLLTAACNHWLGASSMPGHEEGSVAA